MPRRGEVLLAAAIVAAQALWWPVGPGLLGKSPDLRALWLVVPLTALAGTALRYRRHAAEAALAAAMTGTAIGIVLLLPARAGIRVTDVIAGPLAVGLVLFALAVHGSLRRSVGGAVAVPVTCAALVVLLGMPLRAAAGSGVLLGAACALIWASGRRARRRRALVRAEREYRAAAQHLPAWAAAAERRRLAAELHDVAAHRLTGIAVAAAAGLRVDRPELRAEAIEHAAVAGRQAVDELDRLVSLEPARAAATLSDVETLVAGHGIGDFVRNGRRVPGRLEDLAYRVVREALTNAARYAASATMSVRVEARDGVFTVSVTDDGGTVAVGGLGGGQGLAGLQDLVRAAGGVLRAGPRERGWQVLAEVPIPANGYPVRTGLARRGAAVRDRALIVAAAGISLGVVLLPSAGDRDLLAEPGPALLMLCALIAHSVPLGWRRIAPARAMAAAVALLAGWVGACVVGWVGVDPAALFLGSWWIELVLVYSVAAYQPDARRSWWAPLAVAAVGGVALANGPGIHGNTAAVAAVLSSLALVPTGGTWLAGLGVAALRRRRVTAAAQERAVRQRDAAEATASARGHLAARLRRDARQHATAIVAAADSGRLAEVVTGARAALGALRAVIHDGELEGAEPPPGLVALADLAARRRTALTVAGPLAALPAAVEVTGYRAAALLLTDGARAHLEICRDGIEVSVWRTAALEPRAVRELRHIVDEADGSMAVSYGRDTVRIWLPDPTR